MTVYRVSSAQAVDRVVAKAARQGLRQARTVQQLTCGCAAVWWVVGVEVARSQVARAHVLQDRQHHIAFVATRRAVRIKAQERVRPRLLQLQEASAKWVAAVVRQRPVSQQVRVVQHVPARAHRKVRDRHRISLHRRVRPVAVRKRAAALHDRPVLLRCQHKLVCACAACERCAQHAAYRQRVVSVPAAQRRLGNAPVLTFCTGVAGCVVAHRDGVVACTTQRRHGRLAVVFAEPPRHTDGVVIVSAVQRVGLVDLCSICGVGEPCAVHVHTQRISTRTPNQRCRRNVVRDHRVNTISAVQTGRSKHSGVKRIVTRPTHQSGARRLRSNHRVIVPRTKYIQIVVTITAVQTRRRVVVHVHVVVTCTTQQRRLAVHHVTRAAALLQLPRHVQAVVLVSTVQAHLQTCRVQAVIARTTQQGVIPRQRTRRQVVVTVAAVQQVRALVVRQRVVAVATVQTVVTKVAFDLVVTIAAVEHITSGLTVYRVSSAQAVDRVVAAGADQVVASTITVNG